jgi:hypothetical protein
MRHRNDDMHLGNLGPAMNGRADARHGNLAPIEKVSNDNRHLGFFVEKNDHPGKSVS